jgi:hypothetical protein
MQIHVLSCIVLLLAACSSPVAQSSDNTVPSDDSANIDIMAEIGQPETVIFPDIHPDKTEIEFYPDLIPDLAPDLPARACNPGEGCFMDGCDNNEECQSGWCVQHLGEGVCSLNCQEECPAGWTCGQVAGTEPDIVYICVSDYANLCRPCAVNTDCTSTGGAEDACLVYGSQGSFCGGPCGDQDSCPWGFSCKEVTTVDGSTLQQCVNDMGECPCTDNSVVLGLTTPCLMANDMGSCEGKRICSEDGLLPCDAPTPAEENCNGTDDDCDGEIDEPALVEGNYVNLCDDGNDCTTDKCLGEDGCVNEVLDSGACEDQDPCTVADHCSAGVCVGMAVDCDDKNPCTDDACTAEGGCLNSSNQLACDDGNPCTLADQCTDDTCLGTEIPCDCQSDADCIALEDGDLCNGTLVCDTAALPYKCVVAPGTEVLCPAPEGIGAECLEAFCEPATGACSLVPAHDGTLCAGGDACLYNTTCDKGNCEGGIAVNCNDGNPCTADDCEVETGCFHEPDDADCTDANPCTSNDHCSAGVCVGGDDVQCIDDNPCTDDTCDPEVGCIHSLNAAPCDDGDPCTQTDVCQLGVCVPGETTNCDDSNPCTDDGCLADGQCSHIDNTLPCPQGQCAAGICIPDCVPDCAGKVCGGDGCNGSCGACNDDLDCTADACSQGQCVYSPKSFFCLIDNVCVPSGTEAPGNSCRKCQPLDVQTGWTNQSDGSVCDVNHKCETGECVCQTYTCNSLAKTCGTWDNGCGGELFCGECKDFPNSFCDDGVCGCTKDCEGKTCNADGCGGLCGTCPAGQSCIEDVCQTPTHLWSKGFGAEVFDWGQDVAVDSQGNVLVTGYFQSPVVDFGGGPIANAGGGNSQDVFLVKLDKDGNHVWSKGIGGTNWDGGYAVGIGPGDSITVAGSYQSTSLDFGNGKVITNKKQGEYDAFVARYDAAGTCLWAITLGGVLGDNVTDLDVDDEGKVALAGHYQSLDFAPDGVVLPHEGGWDVWFGVLNANGGVVWVQTLHGAAGDHGRSIRFGADGSLVGGGYFNSPTLNAGNNSLPNAAADEHDGFLVKLDAGGNVVWAKVLGAEGSDMVEGLVVHPDGRITVAGTSNSWAVDFGGGPIPNQGENDVFVVRYSADGDHVWSKLTSGPTYASANTLALDSQGTIYVGGNFNAAPIDLGGGILAFKGSYDLFLARYADDGSHLWSIAYGGSGADLRMGVAIAPDDSIILGGAFGSQSISFGGPPVPGKGSYHIFAARLAW